MACIAVVLFCFGCNQNNRTSGQVQVGEWAYVPQHVKIHPLSRFDSASNADEETIIVVHVEFTDGNGFACRGVGELEVTIGEETNNKTTETVLLRDETINRERFDPVTRTYRVHFSNVPKDWEKVKATAVFDGASGTMESKPHTIKNKK